MHVTKTCVKKCLEALEVPEFIPEKSEYSEDKHLWVQIDLRLQLIPKAERDQRASNREADIFAKEIAFLLVQNTVETVVIEVHSSEQFHKGPYTTLPHSITWYKCN